MPEEQKKDVDAEETPKKKRPLLWIILAVVLSLGGTAGGIFLAPLISPAPPKAESESAESAAEGEGKAAAPAVQAPPVVVPWAPLVVDVRDQHGGSHHIKMVITLETANEQLEAELSSFAPRGRQAVLGFIRGQSYENLTDPSKFESLQQKITKLVQQSVGKSTKDQERVQQVLITDLVAQ